MPLYKLDIQFVYETVYWTNKLYIIGTDDENAAEAAVAITDILATGVQNSVTIDKVRITPAPFTKNNFFDFPVNKVGSGGATQPAPLFNVVRWIFTPPRGRSTNHYFRGGVTPSNIGVDQQFTPTAAAFNNALLVQLFDAGWSIVSHTGAPYAGAAASVRVGMRQLRRGSKRKKKPVI